MIFLLYRSNSNLEMEKKDKVSEEGGYRNAIHLWNNKFSEGRRAV